MKVKLQNGSKLKGYISQAGEDSFTLMDAKSGKITTLAYADVAEVKKQGGGLPAIAWIGIGVGIAVGAAAILYGAACGSNDYC